MLAFWTTTGLVGEAASWAALSPDDRNARLDAYHKSNIAVMVAAFGANDIPTAQDPAGVANSLATFVKTYGLDGVDLDYEDTAALYGGTGAQWVSDLTRHLRAALPDKLISHAPQAPYFGPGGGYDTVANTAGNDIDFYNVQYYNQGGDQGCDASMNSGPGNMKSIIASGVPANKIVFGKPLDPQDGNSGWMSPAELVECLKTKPAGWPGSVMFWQWRDGTAPAMMAALSGKAPPPPAPPSNTPAPDTSAPDASAPDAPAGQNGQWTPEGAPPTPATSALPFWQTGRWK